MLNHCLRIEVTKGEMHSLEHYLKAKKGRTELKKNEFVDLVNHEFPRRYNVNDAELAADIMCSNLNDEYIQ